MVWADIKSCQIQQGALEGARITDGIGQCMEMVQQDKVLKTHPRVTSMSLEDSVECRETCFEMGLIQCSFLHYHMNAGQPRVNPPHPQLRRLPGTLATVYLTLIRV
ncbi:uncharacterized protein LOC128966566 isoform X2 [Homo sapiens]|uniref:uncharacterized protein LOC128966566 isoform X2 n=1 Tax=Homo sapiens TaxID=9606 RepID=UPI001FB125EA|nr:uncharacterized protein LOC128966566 isoform X2 [Homo sapiens]